VSARNKARKQSLDLLYESDIRGKDSTDLLTLRDVVEEGPDARPIREYTKNLISGVKQQKIKIDELISTYARDWDMDRLPAVDRNILRIGIFEILWQEDVPEAVAIDEALALAKELSTEESAGYIHGVLGRIASIRGDLLL
jgi:N utilization substance protein B